MIAEELELESRLLERLREGDEAAFETVVRNNIGRMMAVALRLLRDHDEAEDAVQEAFVSAWNSIGGFDGRASLSSWLHRITVNAALARIRARRRGAPMNTGRRSEDRGNDLADARLGPAAKLELAELQRMVWNAVDELAEEHRAVLVLRDVEELSSKEVAASLGLTDSAVRQRLHRARKTIAERLWPELCGTGRLTCGGQLDLLLDLIDQCLEPGTRKRVEDHLNVCAVCGQLFSRYTQSIAAPRACGEAETGQVDPASLTDRILNRIGIA